MQAFSHSTTADTVTGWQQFSCPIAQLDAEENMSLPYGYEVTKETQSKDKSAFLINHHIPDVGLELGNFDEFITERTKILTSELKAVLA